MAEESIGGIPAIHAAPQVRFDAPLPTVFLFHGYTSSKELSSYLGYMMACAGLRVILPEADMHGSRFDGDEARRLGCFWDILKCNIDELPRYRKHYEASGLIDRGRIGVAGTSMGGFAALGCMARYDWVRAGVACMGSGYYLDLSRTLYPPVGPVTASNAAEHARRMQPLAVYDPASRLDKLADRPLLVWHGERDDIVPYAQAQRLRDEMKSRGLDGNLTFLGDPNGVHKLSVAASVACVEFLSRELYRPARDPSS